MANAFELQNVSYRYPSAEAWSLRDISLSVEKGKFIAIMGPNGAGKTTLCHCLNGLIPQLMEGEIRGKILTAGMDTCKFRVQTLAKQVGMVLQDPESQIFASTVWEDTAFGPCNFGYPRTEVETRVRAALEMVRLTGFEGRKTGELSGGQKQRLALAGTLAQKPEILVLDEPASELDPLGRQELYTALDNLRREAQVTVVVVEHSPNEIMARADEVIILNRGEIAWRGDPGELFADPALVERLGLRHLHTMFPEMQVTLNNLTHPGAFATSAPIVEFKSVDYSYGSSNMTLQGINLTIHAGEFVALVGENGAGKTTLVKHINGLLKPHRGEVTVAGMNTKDHPVHRLAQKVGYLFQNPDHQIFAATVEEEIAFGLRNMGLNETEVAERVREALNFIGLSGKRQAHPFTLSRGDRQLMAVASITALKPEVMVVDEPTSGLDWVSVRKLMDMIAQIHKNGTTVVMISHDLDLVAQYATRVVSLQNGQVYQDGLASDLIGGHRDESIEAAATGGPEGFSGISAITGFPKRKFLQRLDVRSKVIVFVMIVAASMLKGPVYNLAMGVALAGLNLWAGARPRRLIQALSPLAPIFLLILLVNAVSIGPGLNHIAVNIGGAARGLSFILRTCTIIAATSLLTVATPVDEMVQLLQKLRVPYEVSFLVTTALRFIPALDQKRIQILEAQMARGAKLNVRGIIGSIKAYIPIMVPLLIYCIVLANSLAMAMLNRGFGFSRKITFLRESRFSSEDYVVLGLLAVFGCLAVFGVF